MLIQNKHYTTIWLSNNDELQIIDQTTLPHQFNIITLDSVNAVCKAIKNMQVRGAGLIGVTAGYGMYLAAKTCPQSYTQADRQKHMLECHEKIRQTRPTAKNLTWALDVQYQNWFNLPWETALSNTRDCAIKIANDDIAYAKAIGTYGQEIIAKIHNEKKSKVNILTHCNAGWLAFTDYGSALSPIYTAHEAGIPLHVWVDETRPRNQGASLTAFELGEQKIEHTLIADNTGGHLMQNNMVDLVIVGADRVCVNGDVANKIGTYLKALAAHDNNIPFYVALPSSTFDFELQSGKDIPIEERDSFEVTHVQGLLEENNELVNVLICPPNTKAGNFAFDVTPARLISGLITERGICKANKDAILDLYPEAKKTSQGI